MSGSPRSKYITENGRYEAGTSTIYLDVNAGRNYESDSISNLAMMRTLSHELTHAIQQWSPEAYDSIKTALLNKISEVKGLTSDELIADKLRRAAQISDLTGSVAERLGNPEDFQPSKDKSLKDDTAKALDEVIADACEMMLKDTTAIETLADTHFNEAKKFTAIIRKFVNRIKTALKEAFGSGANSKEAKALTGSMDSIQQMWDDALVKASRAHSNSSSEITVNSDASFSIRTSDDGYQYVEVDVDQSMFDGQTVDEMRKTAINVIRQRFVGKVIGTTNKVFVNTASAKEYGFSANRNLHEATREAKYRASTELDNIMEATYNPRQKPDGLYGHEHQYAADGFSYLDAVFKVGDELYTGLVNIVNTNKGKLLKDITKIRDITKDTSSSSGDTTLAGILDTIPYKTIVSDNTEGYNSSGETLQSDNPDARYSLRNYDELTSREILADVLSGATANKQEETMLEHYKKNIEDYNKKGEEISLKKAEMKVITDRNKGVNYFKWSLSDRNEYIKLKNQAGILADQLARKDAALLKLETMKPIKNVLDRAKEKVRVKAKKDMQTLLERETEKFKAKMNEIKEEKTLKALIKQVKSLDKRLRNPTDLKHIPQEMRDTVLDMCKLFSEEENVYTGQVLDDVRKEYIALNSNEEFMNSAYGDKYDEDIADMLDTLSKSLKGKLLVEMDSTELKTVWDIVMHITHMTDC